MNKLAMQEMLSFMAVAILLVDVATASILNQRGKHKLAKLVLASGIGATCMLLGIAYLLV